MRDDRKSLEKAERPEFEKAISGPPYELSIDRYPDDAARFGWPGNYKDYRVHLAWDIWMERAAFGAAELQETDELRGRLADILTRTADALKGPPGPLMRHSWHDLAEWATELRAMMREIAASDQSAETIKAWAETALKGPARD